MCTGNSQVTGISRHSSSLHPPFPQKKLEPTRRLANTFAHPFYLGPPKYLRKLDNDLTPNNRYPFPKYFSSYFLQMSPVFGGRRGRRGHPFEPPRPGRATPSATPAQRTLHDFSRRRRSRRDLKRPSPRMRTTADGRPGGSRRSTRVGSAWVPETAPGIPSCLGGDETLGGEK